MWFGVFWCGLVWVLHFLVVINVLLCDLVVIWFWVIWCDIIEARLGLSWFVCGVVWCLLVWFGVIITFFGGNRCFIVWFGCDLVLNYLVWYYWGQIGSELVCFGVVLFLMVWFCVIFNYFCSNGSCMVWFGCDLVLNDLVWYYWGQVRYEFCFWCDLMSFDVVWCDFYIFWW